jgi:hypothetical protein
MQLCPFIDTSHIKYNERYVREFGICRTLLEPLFPSSLHFGSQIQMIIAHAPEALIDILPCSVG